MATYEEMVMNDKPFRDLLRSLGILEKTEKEIKLKRKMRKKKK